MRVLRVIGRGFTRVATRGVFSTLLELAAMGLVVLFVIHFWGLWWALLPIAVCLGLIAWSVSGGRR